MMDRAEDFSVDNMSAHGIGIRKENMTKAEQPHIIG
jgi:hypothetical protein